ncbi:MAG TPA: EAL domain-containing response regulator [Polyangiaceae bacterium]|nr:EAL domain-containing response regulator [Polyangiaceae bacterium]
MPTNAPSPGESRTDATPELEVVVVVDDEPAILRALERSLRGGFQVVAFEAAAQAIERVRRGGVAVVLSDISMPGMSGIELLGAVREHDPDLPVVLITGSPSLESATKAIEHGVFRYLPKPFDDEQLASLVGQASRLHRLARLKREALELHGAPSAQQSPASDRSLRRALDSLSVVYQPIVSNRARKVYGYEALMRSAEPEFPSPPHLLTAAEHAGALHELGRIVRQRAVEGLHGAANDTLLFLNLHPRDLTDPELTRPGTLLSQSAQRIVLEITERASLSGIDDLKPTLAALRRLGFRIAIDDLGAGYAGLTSFALLEPEIVKLDMSLTRAIDQSPVKQKLVASISSLCRDMGMTIVAEGVETMSERDTLTTLGCDLLQGHLFGLPARWPSLPEFDGQGSARGSGPS